MIRKAKLEDVKAVVEVINESNSRAYRDIISREYFKYPVVTEKEIIEDMKNVKFYVYEYNSRIVGVAALQVAKEGIGWIHWVYVHPYFQRRDIGSSLMCYLEDLAGGYGLKKLRLTTHERATWAIRFYEKLGYMIIEYVDRITWIDSVMEKELR